MKALAEAAVDAALGAGASYADARAVTLRRQYVITKNGQVDDLSDAESEGIGVRVLVNGAWGFAGEGRLDEAAARDAALRAAGFARAAPGRHETSLAPVDPESGEHRTPVDRDPFAVSLSEKVDLCLRAEEGMRQPDVKVTTAMVRTVMSPGDGGGATDRQHALLARRAEELELTDQQSSPPGTQGTSGLNRYGRASLTIGRMSGAVSPHPHGPLTRPARKCGPLRRTSGVQLVVQAPPPGGPSRRPQRAARLIRSIGHIDRSS